MKLKKLADSSDDNGHEHLSSSQNDDTDGSPSCQMKQEDVLPPTGEIGNSSLLNFKQVYIGSSPDVKSDKNKTNMVVKDVYGSLVQTNLTISLAAPSGNSPFFAGPVGEREYYRPITSFQHGSTSHHLPKVPKSIVAAGLDSNTNMLSQIRVARPPVEGQVKNQLLPRYWPRITDQELQQISGDSNSTIVPLFEKVLSASDAGRIGRLVLPKACAEAYFPPISQPEGLPLRIQDVKGKEWVFQFRFWPNNNSRMYVLEGVTPCIQSMQLQAGDTVTFSRMEPEGKLLMGFRKASNTLTVQSLKGSTDIHMNALAKQFTSTRGDVSWQFSENHGGKADSLLPQPVLVPERKRSRNIGSKSKRLLFDSQDALELKLTWEEAQDMLRPPPSVKPSTVTLEDQEFEEYEEPPVFGKRSIFTVRLSGVPCAEDAKDDAVFQSETEQEQWAQCDSCSKWRRLPPTFLLPSKWTCQANAWDQSRCSCSAPDELSPRELENLLKLMRGMILVRLYYKKRRLAASDRPAQEHESASLDAQPSGAVSGETALVATTTKHPRHRPGCSCIVCIQPPSGKGKHKPTCTCNVCMTVKRRFKTLMMRKKKRQSEREAEIAQKNEFLWRPKEEAEVDSISRQGQGTLQLDPLENEANTGSESQSKCQSNNQFKGQLDLNSHPHREEDLNIMSTRVSMMGLLQVANLPLETYLKQNGLTSLISEQQASSGSHALPQATGESEGRLHDGHSLAPALREQERGCDEELCVPDPSQTDPSINSSS
ncbi:hypothetical protein RJ639_007229 [Escallonia herrerae]|uniref:Uncharacterized protein n=1 Tax=Escallonia herrerae TaxID=1293975 RepID=A0AA88VX42_9ASTE|nr:hypothetical protein RJ639_007229 [Escallonia herrerae]